MTSNDDPRAYSIGVQPCDWEGGLVVAYQAYGECTIDHVRYASGNQHGATAAEAVAHVRAQLDKMIEAAA